MKLIFPDIFAVDERRVENRIRYIAEPATSVEGTVARFARDRIEGWLFTAANDGAETLIIPKVETSSGLHHARGDWQHRPERGER